MMTAVAVLALLITFLGKSVDTMSQSWIAGQRRANNFAKARAMLDMFSRDIQSGVFRADLASFPSGTASGSDIAFYTQRAGVATGSQGLLRNLSLVRYQFDASPNNVTGFTTLERGDAAISWNSPASLVSFGNTAKLPQTSQLTYRSTAPGVIAFKILFVLADGTLSATCPSGPSAANPAKGAGLALAVVDDEGLKQLTLAQASALRLALDGAAGGTRSVQGDWQRYLATAMNWNTYPKGLAQGLRIFERYVRFPDL